MIGKCCLVLDSTLKCGFKKGSMDHSRQLSSYFNKLKRPQGVHGVKLSSEQ